MYGATLVGKNSYYNYHRVSKDRAALPCTVYSSACVAGALYCMTCRAASVSCGGCEVRIRPGMVLWQASKYL